MDSLLALMPEFWKAAGETLYIVGFTLFFGGLGGLLVGLGLYLSRAGSILANRPLFLVLNLFVNIVRPIPFIIFLAAAQPLARMVVGTGIGHNAIIFTISLAASFAMGRIVEQNLLTVTPGVIEAARSVGAGPLRIIFTVLVPEALWAARPAAVMPDALRQANAQGVGRDLFTGMRRNALSAEQGALSWM